MSEELRILNERVTNLEQALARLQSNVEIKSHWLDRFREGVTDVEAFEEVIRLGREFRKSYLNDSDVGTQS